MYLYIYIYTYWLNPHPWVSYTIFFTFFYRSYEPTNKREPLPLRTFGTDFVAARLKSGRKTTSTTDAWRMGVSLNFRPPHEGFLKWGYPQMVGLFHGKKALIKMDDLGVAPFQETSMALGLEKDGLLGFIFFLYYSQVKWKANFRFCLTSFTVIPWQWPKYSKDSKVVFFLKELLKLLIPWEPTVFRITVLVVLSWTHCLYSMLNDKQRVFCHSRSSFPWKLMSTHLDNLGYLSWYIP